MSWFDYIPLVGSAVRLAKGDYKQAGIDVGGIPSLAAQSVSNKEDQYKSGLDFLYNQLQNTADYQRDLQMKGLDKAEGYYQPAQDRLNALYGPPGAFKK